MKTLKILVTTEDGEVLDMNAFEVPDNTRAIAFRPITVETSSRPDEDTLITGELK